MVWFDPLAGALFIVMVMKMTGHLYNMHMQSQQLQPVHNYSKMYTWICTCKFIIVMCFVGFSCWIIGTIHSSHINFGVYATTCMQLIDPPLPLSYCIAAYQVLLFNHIMIVQSRSVNWPYMLWSTLHTKVASWLAIANQPCNCNWSATTCTLPDIQ